MSPPSSLGAREGRGRPNASNGKKPYNVSIKLLKEEITADGTIVTIDANGMLVLLGTLPSGTESLALRSAGSMLAYWDRVACWYVMQMVH